MMMLSWLRPHRYERLPGGGAKGARRADGSWKSTKIHLFYTLAILVTAVTSYRLAHLTSQQQEGIYGFPPVSFVLQLKTAPYTFALNTSFAYPPSDEVNRAWGSLLPKGGGFFKHPTLAPKYSCMAVFHQIHCLDMLRQALYEALPGMVGGHHGSSTHDTRAAMPPTNDPNHEHDLGHLGHCFDLLRQSLMCRPDLTVEVGNETLMGVTGFGTEHQCVDWNQLMSWMEIFE